MRRLALLLCAFALAFPACGEDDEQQASPAATATATPTEDSGGRGGYNY
jgi:hypothetical protein